MFSVLNLWETERSLNKLFSVVNSFNVILYPARFNIIHFDFQASNKEIQQEH